VKLTNQARYPAPASVVMKMFSDPAFHERKLAALGVARYSILSSGTQGTVFSILIERKVPMNLPGMKSGPEASVTHE
jgi:hypothetical protein